MLSNGAYYAPCMHVVCGRPVDCMEPSHRNPKTLVDQEWPPHKLAPRSYNRNVIHSKTEERNCVGITSHLRSAPPLPSPPPLLPLLAPLLVLPPPLMHKAMLLAPLLLALPSPLKLPLLQLPSLKHRV